MSGEIPLDEMRGDSIKEVANPGTVQDKVLELSKFIDPEISGLEQSPMREGIKKIVSHGVEERNGIFARLSSKTPEDQSVNV